MLKSSLWAAAFLAGSIAPVLAQSTSPVVPTTPTQQAAGATAAPTQPPPPEQPLPNAQSSAPSSTPSAAPKQQGEIQELPAARTPGSRQSQQAPDSQQSRDRYAGSRGYPEGRGDDDERFEPRWPSRESRRFGWDDDRREPRQWHHHFQERHGYMQRGMPPQGFGLARLCNSDPSRVAQSLAARVERVTQPTADQRAALDNLKQALGNAAGMLHNACTTERPVSPPAKLALAEKRLSAMLEAVRTVRPALDTYYNALSDEQKMQLALAHREMESRRMGEQWNERSTRPQPRMDDDERDYTGSASDYDDDDDSEH